MSTSESSIDKVDDNTTLWKYVTKIEKLGTGGGNWHGNVVIVMNILKGHTQDPISCTVRCRN